MAYRIFTARDWSTMINILNIIFEESSANLLLVDLQCPNGDFNISGISYALIQLRRKAK